jgi:hypothetical protein
MSCLAFVACTGDEGLIGSSSQSGFIITIGDEAASDSRTVPAELDKPVAKNFNLFIKSTQSNYVVYEGGYTDQVIPAPAGEFVLTASYGNNSTIAFDEPYYKGSVTATVVDKETTSVTIPCYVANSLISVEFKSAATFDNYYSSYALRVVVGQSTLELNKDNCEKSIYLPADRSDVKFYLVATPIGGSAQRFDLTDDLAQYLPLAAGDHAKITLTAANFGISVDKVEVVKETVSQTIPLTWLPAPTAKGFGTISYVETDDAPESASITYQAAISVDDISLTFNFEDEQYSAYNKEFLLSELTEADSKLLSDIGLNLSSVSRLAKGELDFKTLIETLQTNAGATTHNTIKFKLLANERWSNEVECAINVTKPEFTIHVYPGDIWTKEFTVSELEDEDVTAGNAERINARMQYQYSTDGNTWTNMPSDLRLANLNPETKFYVRGIYRGAWTTNVVEFKTYPTPAMENGDMETWTAEERGYYYGLSSSTAKLRVYYPWKGSKYWDTNNDFTTRYRDASTYAFSTVYLYNSFPAVSYTPNSHTGSYAAELRNTAAGRGNTSSSKSSYSCNNVPGELFIGDLTVTNKTFFGSDSYTITEGRSYASHPTALNFWFKYSPYTTDYFKAYIAIYDADGNIIGEGTYQNGNTVTTYTNCQVDITYKSEYVKSAPAKIYVYFGSSIYSGDSLPYHSMSVLTWYNGSSRTNTTLSGSVLTIDDISLIYDK